MANLPAQISDAARAAIARAIERILAGAEPLFAAVHDAVAEQAPEALRSDPGLAAEIERSNAAILAHWLIEVARDPAARIAPLRTPETTDIARDTARRGLEDFTAQYFRAGLQVAAQHVLDAAFAEESDPVVLREVLGVLVASSTDYVDRSAAMIAAMIAEERDTAAAATGRRRLDAVLAILDGEDRETAAASSRLGFALDRELVACALWASPHANPGTETLERVARELAAAAGASGSLVVPASAATVWFWCAGELRPERAGEVLATQHHALRLAIGEPGSGVSGFRRSHEEAIRTQRVMQRLGPALRAAVHHEVRLVELATQDEAAAAEFARATLGALAGASPALRSTLLCLIEQAFDTRAVAARLGLHRNTVLARLRRARELLPRSGGEIRWVDVALALELDRWQQAEAGAQAPAATGSA